MNRFNRFVAACAALPSKAIEGGRNLAIAGAVGMTALALSTGDAHAGALADAITTEVTTAKAEILLVGAVMLGLTGVILLIAYVRRAAK
jgi:hypothetical protein